MFVENRVNALSEFIFSAGWFLSVFLFFYSKERGRQFVPLVILIQFYLFDERSEVSDDRVNLFKSLQENPLQFHRSRFAWA